MNKYDLIIKNGIIIDGTTSPPFKADIAIVNDIITKIGDLTGEKAEKIIDARGLYVAPGFIDMHNHSDVSVFVVPTADNYIRQGVTTIVIGNCGASPAPLTELNRSFVKDSWRPYSEEVAFTWGTFGEYLDKLDELKKSVNIVPLIGHGTLRSAIMGTEDREPTQKDLNNMKELLIEALEKGAYGLSTGLIYVPGVFSKTNEIIELAKVVAKYNGIYASHIRNEGTRLIDAVNEVLRIALEARVSAEISHLKSSGKPNWGKVEIVLKIIEEYALRGHDISADAYPYTAASTELASLLPAKIREGGYKELIKRLRDPRVIEEIRKLGLRGIDEGLIDAHDIMISYSPSHKELEGKRLDDIAREWSLDITETIAKLLIDDEGATGMILFTMSENDVRKVISHPYVAIGSDGSIKKFGLGKPHPRNYGTFPRVIAKYVREEKVLSLPEAIRKMTSLPARKLKLWNRGIIRPRMKADIVIFDYYTITDTATYENPHSYPKGIKYVIVNGEIVVEDEEHTGRKPGKLLRRTNITLH